MIDSVTGILIVGVVVALLFGAKKLPEMARNFGRATKEFQKGKLDAEKELDDMKKSVTGPAKDIADTIHKG